MNDQHTPEPWGPGTEVYISAKAGEKFGPHFAYPQGHNQELCEANARRIVACVNACAGLSTVGLEKVGADFIKPIAELEQQRDQLLAALEHIATAFEAKTTSEQFLMDEARAAIAAVKGGAQ